MARLNYTQPIPLKVLTKKSKLENSSQSSFATFDEMKFNHSLQFNAVPEWSGHYLDYSKLKKLIYSLEKQQVDRPNDDIEHSPLMPHTDEEPDIIFGDTINSELQKIDEFYTGIENKAFDDLEVLLADEADFDKQGVTDVHFSRPYSDRLDQQEEPDNEDQRSIASTIHSSHKVEEPGHSMMSDYKITLKKRAIIIYVSLCEVQSFAELNKTGFTKALKKYRKTLKSNLTADDLALSKSYAFNVNTESNLQDKIDEAVSLYARVTECSESQARQALKVHLREHVVWERNTVWRDMIGLERRAYGASAGETPIQKLSSKSSQVQTYLRIGNFSVPIYVISTHILKLMFIMVVFLWLIIFPVFESTEQSNCLALVVTASLLWATEAMPLFVTSLLVPFLVVLLRIPKDEKTLERLSAEAASKFIFSQMWSSVIVLLLGGFTLAAALSKYQVAQTLATAILNKSGSNPRLILLNLMFVATFLSMWISNVAAPVLCFSIAQPLLRTLPDGSPFAKTIVFGIALAANVGGMVSPIASPQNIIALENMNPEPSWGQWFMVAIPVSLISLMLIWGLLILTFPIKDAFGSVSVSHHVRPINDRFTFVQYYICGVSTVTIILWIFSHQLGGVFGEMGVIALLPIVLFFGPGLLTPEDFNNFLWTIIALAMGGIALGKAVSSSGLLHTIAYSIETQVEGMSLYGVMLVFGFMILVVATFVSHTVAALIILPLVASIGSDLPNPKPGILVMASALLCSGAMGLPTSGFPNVTAICMTDNLGKPYLTVGTFISRGVIASMLVYVVVSSVGFILMVWAGL